MKPIAITLHNRSELDRTAEFVAIGVPFTRGELRELPPLVVTGEDGEKLPTQAHPLLEWDDGSVKFALVQFPGTVGANATAEVWVEAGEAPEPSNPCRLIEHDDRIEIDTGPAQFVINRSRTAGLDRVVVDGREVLGDGFAAGFFMLGVQERTGHLIGEVERIEVEERGPLRVMVRLHGKMVPPEGVDRHFGFELALIACAGERTIRAQYTFIAQDTREIYPVERLGLRLLFGHEESVAYRIDGVPGPHEGAFSKGGGAFHAFRSVDGDRYFFTKSGSLDRGERLPGRATFRTSNTTVGVAIREFEGNGPGGYRLGWDKTNLAAEVRLYDGVQRTLRLGQGRSRTHDVFWCFGGPDADLDVIHRALAAFQAPIVPSPDPVYVCGTGAFGTLAPEGHGAFEGFDRSIRAGFEAWRREMDADPRNRGMMHYGDFVSSFGYGAPVGLYMDQEYDPAHGLYLLWARSGDPEYFEVAGRLVRHFIDVDVHQLTGHQSFHGYPPTVERHEESFMAHRTDWGHLFNDSAVDHYLVTGDRRARRIACTLGLIAREAGGDVERYGDLAPRYVFKGAERTFGWPVITMARAYEVTRDERYMEVIERILNYLDRFSEDPWREYAEGGRWWRTMMHDGCKPFMVGLLMEGFCRYHEVSRDPKIIEVLTRIADWLIANMWNDALGTFEYEFNAYNPGHRTFAADDLMALPLMYLYSETKTPTYLHVLRKMVGPTVERFAATRGKEFGMVSRTSPHFLALYASTLEDELGEVGPFRSYVRARNRPLPIERRFEEVLRAPLDGALVAQAEGGTVEPRVHGAPEWVEGPGGIRAARFDVEGGHGDANLNVPNHAAYPCPKDTLLEWGGASLWVRHDKDMSDPGDPYTRPLLYIRGERPKRDSLLLCFIYNELRVRIYDSNGWLCGAAETPLVDLSTGEWHHYAVTWQPNGLHLYVNGELRATDAELVLPDGEQCELFVGWCDSNWRAGIDQADLRLIRGSVAAEEVGRIMIEER